MSLRIRHIRLRAQTEGALYGADVSLEGGLTVLHAPNTSGKSTVLHAFLYALGLEQMLSPKRGIPLSYAMTSHVVDPHDGTSHPIVESYVAVEIENAAGARITVRRNVKATSDYRLVSVLSGPELSVGPGEYERRDYYAIDPGAAQNQDGFHHMLARFIGWDLPMVKRYDGGDCPLYVETLFPLFFVEQKVGWTTIPGAIPTQFRIREVHLRSVEFILGFETHDLELRRQEMEMQLSAAQHTWSKAVDAALAMATAAGLKIANLQPKPTSMEEQVRSAFLQVRDGQEWVGLNSHVQALRHRLAELKEEDIPSVEVVADSARAEVDGLNLEIFALNSARADIFRDRQGELIQQASTLRRIEQLEEDLQKNKDAQKLERFGSMLGRDLMSHQCPTCEQSIDDVLLPQGTLEAVMSLEENIEYISAQKKVFKRLVDRSEVSIRDLDFDLLSTSEVLRQKSSRLRTLKSDLIAPSHDASAAFIEERLRLEQRISQLVDVVGRFEEMVEKFVEHSQHWLRLQSAKESFPKERLSASDVSKIGALERSIRSQLVHYQFETFAADALTVSQDSYRPEKEGFEIGFELSASDSVRLKWAYQLGLLDVALSNKTNHPGLVVFDEPRQQEAAEISVAGLLSEAARIAGGGAQVLIATSEKLSTVESFIDGLGAQLVKFNGRMIQRIS